MKRRLPSIPPPVSVLLLTLVAFALRIYMLDYFSLRGDESFTVLFVQKPFAEMWNEIRTVEPNPPLMYLLLRGWVGLAGAGEFATRFFSVFWGVLCVPLIYRLAMSFYPTSLPAPSLEGGGKRARGEVMAIVAAFLIAINPYQIWHSQDVRNYTMWPALSLLALLFFWRWTHPGKVPSGGSSLLILGAFVFAELAALYTHYYEAFILVGVNLYVLFFLVRRRAWAGWKSPSLMLWAGAQVILAILYLPFPLIISNRVASYGEGSGQQGVSLWEIWQRTFNVFTLGETLDESVRHYAWIPLAFALAVILIARWRSERRGLFFLLYIGVPTFAVFLLNLVRPLFLERYLNGIAPGYYLLFAWGISALFTSRRLMTNPQKPPESEAMIPNPTGPPDKVAVGRLGAIHLVKRGAALLALVVFALLSAFALANYLYNPAYAKSPDWRGLARAIDAESRKGDVILQNFPETSLVYYDRSGLPLVVYPQTYMPDARTTQSLEALNGKFRRVWFIPAGNEYWDPDQFVEEWLDRHDDLLVETRVASFRLELYGTPAQFLSSMQPLDANLGKLANLIGYRLDRQGPVWHVVLYWRAQATTKKGYDVLVRLIASGTSQVFAQVQRAPVNGTYPTNQWRRNELIVDQYDLDISAGADELSVGMYDSTASAPLPVFDGKGNPRGDAISIPLPISP